MLGVEVAGWPFRWSTVGLAALVSVSFAGIVGFAAGPAGATPAITAFSGAYISGPASIVTGPDDALWFANNSSSTIGRIVATPSGHGFVSKSYTSAHIFRPNVI